MAVRDVTSLYVLLQVEANPEKPAAVTALGTLQNLAAESNANKEAIREAGGIPVLIGLIRDCPDALVRAPPGSGLLQQEAAWHNLPASNSLQAEDECAMHEGVTFCC